MSNIDERNSGARGNGSPEPEGETIIAERQINAYDSWRLTLGTYRNQPVVDLRRWTQTNDRLPCRTRQGFTVHQRHLPELAAAFSIAARLAGDGDGRSEDPAGT